MTSLSIAPALIASSLLQTRRTSAPSSPNCAHGRVVPRSPSPMRATAQRLLPYKDRSRSALCVRQPGSASRAQTREPLSRHSSTIVALPVPFGANRFLSHAPDTPAKTASSSTPQPNPHRHCGGHSLRWAHRADSFPPASPAPIPSRWKLGCRSTDTSCPATSCRCRLVSVGSLPSIRSRLLAKTPSRRGLQPMPRFWSDSVVKAAARPAPLTRSTPAPLRMPRRSVGSRAGLSRRPWDTPSPWPTSTRHTARPALRCTLIFVVHDLWHPLCPSRSIAVRVEPDACTSISGRFARPRLRTRFQTRTRPRLRPTFHTTTKPPTPTPTPKPHPRPRPPPRQPEEHPMTDPPTLRYTEAHEWVLVAGDTVTIG